MITVVYSQSKSSNTNILLFSYSNNYTPSTDVPASMNHVSPSLAQSDEMAGDTSSASQDYQMVST